MPDMTQAVDPAAEERVLAMVLDRMMSGDHDPSDWERKFAAEIVAFAASECASRDAEIERLTAARNLAYGLLWGMSIDRRRVSDDLAARARETLLATMSKDDQRAGIDAARAALSNKDAG